MRNWLFLLLGLAFSNLPLLAAEPEDRDFFEKKVRPLLFDQCQKCHSTQTKKQRGGLLLDSRSAILKGGDNGPAVIPGQPDKSLLIQAIHYNHTSLHMPPSGKLAAPQIAVLEEWVLRGIPYPEAGAAVAGKKGIDLEKGRQFWSF